MNKTIEDKLNEERQYRKLVSIEAKSDEKIVEGYATTFDTPYLLFRDGNYEVWEQVSPNAFDKTDMADVIMQYDHQGRVFARIRNKTLELTADDHGLHIRANLGGTEIGRQLYEEIAGGYTDKMSFGFTVRGDNRDEREEDGKVIILRTITDIGKLYDVSAVSLPANDTTEISARSYCEGVIAEVAEEIRQRKEREAEEVRKREERLATINRIKSMLEVQS